MNVNYQHWRWWLWSEERFQRTEELSISVSTRPPVSMSRKESCMQEKGECSFRLASWIYGLGKRSCVTNARGGGIYWAFPMMDDTCRLNLRQPFPIEFLCDNWPLSISPAPKWETCTSLSAPLLLSFLTHWLGLSRSHPRNTWMKRTALFTRHTWFQRSESNPLA